MGWYELSSLISDSRIKFLLAFIVFAILVAVGLVVYELKMKKKEETKEKVSEDENYIARVRRVVRTQKTPREKLENIDVIVKKYFKENYGTHLNSSYSTIINEFEKTGRADFLEFLDLIFTTFYSRGSISEETVEEVAKSFIGAVRRKEHEEELEKGKPLGDKFKEFFLFPINFVRSKIEYLQRSIRRNKRIKRQKEMVLRKESEQKRIQEENIVLKKTREKQMLLEELRKSRQEKEVQQKIVEVPQKIMQKDTDSSELKEKSIARKVPFNFGKANFLKDWKNDPDMGLTEKPVPQPDLKIMKDSISGDFEMYPPVDRKKSSEVLGNGAVN